MTIPLNLDNVEAWKGGAVLPPGNHNIKVYEATEEPARTGTPQIVLKMVAVDGADAGSTITDWISVTPKSLGRVRMVLEAFGIQIPAGNFNFDANALVGRQAQVTVREEPDRQDPNKTRTNVKAYDKVGAVAATGDPLANGAPPIQQNNDPLAGAGFVHEPAAAAAPVADDSIPF